MMVDMGEQARSKKDRLWLRKTGLSFAKAQAENLALQETRGSTAADTRASYLAGLATVSRQEPVTVVGEARDAPVGAAADFAPQGAEAGSSCVAACSSAACSSVAVPAVVAVNAAVAGVSPTPADSDGSLEAQPATMQLMRLDRCGSGEQISVAAADGGDTFGDRETISIDGDIVRGLESIVPKTKKKNGVSKVM